MYVAQSAVVTRSHQAQGQDYCKWEAATHVADHVVVQDVDAQVPGEDEVKQVAHVVDVEAQKQSSCVRNGSVTSPVIVL